MDKILNELERIFINLKNETKTIHCLTNPISINDMANVILALNQSPIMADNPDEVEEISSKADSILLNLGNIQAYRMDSMTRVARLANKMNIPLVIDLVGVSASSLRLNFAIKLLKDYNFDLVKGNYSEVYSLEEAFTTTSGVDSKDIDHKKIMDKAKILSDRYKTKILASGKEDIVYGLGQGYILKNGDYRLKSLTGTGCILGGICASSLAIENTLEAVVLATSIENISSEGIDKSLGLLSFKLKFLDNISLINMERIKERISYEKY